LQGQFKDSYVEGISYSTGTQSGITDIHGTFSYRAEETVTFALGNVVLVSASGSQLVTPVDLVAGATDEKNDAVANIGCLLQSLDLDGNPDNGISLDFSAPGFGNSPALSDLFRRLNNANLFSKKRCLVSPREMNMVTGAIIFAWTIGHDEQIEMSDIFNNLLDCKALFV
jgi:hypothetical protein